MSNILYVDKGGTYNLLDYRRSHSELLVRKRENQTNIDVIFKSIQIIVIPITLEGIEISLIEDEGLVSSLRSIYSITTENGYKVYCIKNNAGKSFYLNGGVFGVFRNELDILDSSLGDFMWSDKNELLFWSGDVGNVSK